MTDRSADELERDAESIRSGIARTTDELKTRMSPGQMVDEVTRYLRDSDGAIAVDRLRHQVRENPMALALVGAGLAWLMIGNGEQSSSRDRDRAYGTTPRLPQSYGTGSTAYPAAGTGGASSPAYPAARSSGVGTGSASGSTSSPAASSGSSMRERASGLAEQAGSFAHDASDRARALGHDASERARALGHDAAERGRHVGELSRDYVDYGRRSLLDALDREPLITGAIGLAVGAAIGSMLPTTRLENETFGETRDDLVRSAGDALSDARHRAEQVAGEAYDAARDAADREGLVPKDGDRTMTDRVGSVAKAAADAAAGSEGSSGSGQGVGGTSKSGTSSGTSSTAAGTGTPSIEPKHSLGAEGRVGQVVTPGSDDRTTQGSTRPGSGRI